MARRIVLLAALAVVLVGCGDRPGYDAPAVEAYLVRHVQIGGATHADHARCPKEADLREGMRLRCSLELDDAKLPYVVRLESVRQERVQVHARPDGRLVSDDALARTIRSALPDTSAGARVDCGAGWVVVKQGHPLSCHLVLGSQSRDVTVDLDRTGRLVVGS